VTLTLVPDQQQTTVKGPLFSIQFISLKNSMNITVERITVSRNSKAEIALTAALDSPTNIHTNYQPLTIAYERKNLT